MKRWTTFLSVTLLLLVLGACGPVKMPPSEREDAGDARPARVVDDSVIDALTPSQKRSAIATSFPAEVPAPRGTYTRAEAQGPDAWVYDVEVDASAAAVMEWYRASYLGRQWVVVRSGDFDGPDGGGTFIDLRKNSAQSSVNVFGDDSDGVTRVRVTVGVGTPVLDTQ